MFEPDGRNSIQTIGHSAYTAFRVVCMIVGLVLLTPAVLFFTAKDKMEAQASTIQSYNDTLPTQAVLVDFGTPDLSGLDAPYVEGGPDTFYQSLPFTMTRLKDVSTSRGLRVWKPVDPKSEEPWGPLYGPALRKHANSWVWINLPFVEGQIWGWDESTPPRLWPEADGSPQVYHSALRDKLEEAFKGRHIVFRWGLDDARNDPWIINGALKLAPTRWWDWYSGQQQLEAKASYNYKAYVAAARAASAMRYWAALRLSGTGMPVGVLVCGDPPTESASSFHPPMDLRFAAHYQRVFNNKLPKVVMHLQGFYHGDIKGYGATRTSSMTVSGTPAWPFVTGMHLDDGSLKPRARAWGRPEFSRRDFLLNSTPVLNDQAVEAQKALEKMLEPDFWVPLFTAEGLTDADTLNVIPQVMAKIKKDLDSDTHWARRWGHAAYHHSSYRPFW